MRLNRFVAVLFMLALSGPADGQQAKKTPLVRLSGKRKIFMKQKKKGSNGYDKNFWCNGRAGNIRGVSIVRASGDQDRNSRGPNGFAFIKGNNAARSARIIWDGNAVTTANKQNGGFSFTGAVPHDCIGELSDGVSTINVQVLDCTPVSAAPAPVPRTGQTTSYAASDDGALQRGVVLSTPRFTDNSNGMITDNLTGLIWLKNANCPNAGRGWAQALADVASLNTNGTMNSNNCGDTSKGGSHQTDWRLPNIRELFSLVHFGFFEPALSNAAGTSKWNGSDDFKEAGAFHVLVVYCERLRSDLGVSRRF